MADYYGVSRPGGGPGYLPLQAHDRWRRGLFTGRLALTYRTPEKQYVAPGTGNLVLRQDAEGIEVVVAEAARREGLPVLPGSGIKGAVRTIYELLSNACDSMNNPCEGNDRCEACRLFGGLRYQGRVSFGDAVPPSPDEVESHVERVPMPFPPDGEKTEGDFRFYDLSRHSSWEEPGKKPIAREMFEGSFHGELFFTNALAEEMGRLLICLGLGGDRAPTFLLQLGGARYDGWGAVEVGIGELLLATPPLERKTYEPNEAGSFTKQWLEAVDNSWLQTYKTPLEKLAALHSPERSRQ